MHTTESYFKYCGPFLRSHRYLAISILHYSIVMRAAFLRALPLHSQHIHFRLLQTAAEAASTVSYTRRLFLGVNNAVRAFPYPKVSVEEQETLQLLVTSMAKYFENVDSKQIDEKKRKFRRKR